MSDSSSPLAGARAFSALQQCYSSGPSTGFDIILASEGPALLVTARSLPACGKTVAIFGWFPARTIGSTFGRICFSGTESRLPRQTPSRLVPLSIAVLRPDAISVARSISMSPQKCSGSSKNPLSHSLRIRYFVMKELAANPSFAPRVAHQLGRSSPASLLWAGGDFCFSIFYFRVSTFYFGG
jgi:hypothetical protein